MALIRNASPRAGDALPFEEPGQVPGGGRRLELAPGARCPHLPVGCSENHDIFSQDYGYWYKDFFLTPDMMTAYFAIDRQTMANGCIKMLKGSNHLGRIDHGSCSSSLCSFFRSHKEAASTAGGSGIPSPERTP